MAQGQSFISLVVRSGEAFMLLLRLVEDRGYKTPGSTDKHGGLTDLQRMEIHLLRRGRDEGFVRVRWCFDECGPIASVAATFYYHDAAGSLHRLLTVAFDVVGGEWRLVRHCEPDRLPAELRGMLEGGRSWAMFHVRDLNRVANAVLGPAVSVDTATPPSAP